MPEAQAHPLVVAILRLIQIDMPFLELPHTLIEPLALRAAKADGSIKAWGGLESGGKDAPTNKGYIKIYSSNSAFAALKADGSITSWGNFSNKGRHI
jgi:hypothetical protein